MKRPSRGYRYLRVDSDVLRQEIYVTSVGWVNVAAGSPYPAAGHPREYDFNWNRGRVIGDFIVLLLGRGSGVFETRSGAVRCRAGDALLIPPGIWHRYRPDRANGWEERWICANGEFLHRLRAKRCFVGEAAVCRGAANDPVLAAHRRMWDRVRQGEPANDLALAAEALQILSLAMRSITTDRLPRRTVAPAAGDLVANSASEFIWFNSHRTLTVGLIAREVGVSRRTLERRYLRANGRTVIHELTARRVERARQLLAETKMSVKEISYTVGFGESRRLARNFRRATGLTPGGFRRAVTGSGSHQAPMILR